MYRKMTNFIYLCLCMLVLNLLSIQGAYAMESPAGNEAVQQVGKLNPYYEEPGVFEQDEQKSLDLMNAERTKNGLKPLKFNKELFILAEFYAQDMIERNYFSHYDLDGNSPFDRMQKAKIKYVYAGENLAINGNAELAQQAFMNSPTHQANILNPNFTEVGIGVQYGPNGSIYVVQEFIG